MADKIHWTDVYIQYYSNVELSQVQVLVVCRDLINSSLPYMSALALRFRRRFANYFFFLANKKAGCYILSNIVATAMFSPRNSRQIISGYDNNRETLNCQHSWYYLTLFDRARGQREVKLSGTPFMSGDVLTTLFYQILVLSRIVLWSGVNFHLKE